MMNQVTQTERAREVPLAHFLLYFLRLGTFGFGVIRSATLRRRLPSVFLHSRFTGDGSFPNPFLSHLPELLAFFYSVPKEVNDIPRKRIRFERGALFEFQVSAIW
jgi:hypothetical protein